VAGGNARSSCPKGFKPAKLEGGFDLKSFIEAQVARLR
jgi:hypothetical protein